MNEKYSALFTPWKIGSVEIKNRIVQPAMGGTSLFGWLEPCHFDREAALTPTFGTRSRTSRQPTYYFRYFV